jgi:hypothetical protein
LNKRTSHSLAFGAALTPAYCLFLAEVWVRHWQTQQIKENDGRLGSSAVTRRVASPSTSMVTVYCLRKNLFVDIGGGP